MGLLRSALLVVRLAALTTIACEPPVVPSQAAYDWNDAEIRTVQMGEWYGSGVLQPSGEASVSAEQSASMEWCDSSPKLHPRPFGYVDENPPGRVSFAVLAIGDKCFLQGAPNETPAVPSEDRRLPNGFLPRARNSCTLDFGGPPRTVEVGDVEIRPGLTDERGIRHSSVVPDWDTVEIHVGGTDVATGTHVVYQLWGHNVGGGSTPKLCARALEENRESQAKSPSRE